MSPMVVPPLNTPVKAGTSMAPKPGASKMFKVGAPVVLAVTALISVPFLMGSGDNAVRTGDVASTTTTAAPVTLPAEDAIFTSTGVTSEPAPITTAAPATTTTTTAVPATTTTTTAIAKLPEQPAAPIAPPADPRGDEDEIRLGGISIPKLGVSAPLFSGIRLTTLDKGPGHWPGTALPGEVGNVVVAAHRTSHGGPFRNIDQLVAGDAVMFTTDDGEIEYVVTGTQIVNPDAIWIVDPTDTPTATLFACHPPGSVAQRIVVNLELKL
jgi:sortase A